MVEMIRCAWACHSEAERDYHDTEWGVPLHDDVRLFELLVLEGAQAGLSWSTILKKRAGYRTAFDGFDPRKVAAYDAAKIAELLDNPGIVRHRLKIQAAIINAQQYLNVQQAFGSFDAYLWRFVNGETLHTVYRDYSAIPAQTQISAAMSKDLKTRGFKFVGPTVCYAYMQAVGMVNDHTVDCFRWRELGGIEAPAQSA